MNRYDKITERLSKDMHDPWEMDRRDFMRKIGGGLVIAFSLSDLKLFAGSESFTMEKEGVNAYLKVGEDGRVKLYTGKIEMGQGPITSLPMELADELDVSLDSVDIIMGDTDICPYDGGTFGSLTTRTFGQVLRAAAAEARAILLRLAAEELSVAENMLKVSDGVVSVESENAKSITYAELTKGKEILRTISEKPSMKKASEFKVMGKSRLHVDAEIKVTGEARYSGDIQLPGMMHARILRPPSLGAKLLSVDTSGAEALEGVEIVRDEDLIAVLHESKDMADFAIIKVKAEYEEEALDIDDNSIYKYLIDKASVERNIGSHGNMSEGETKSEKLFESEFLDPYIAHAPVEPHTATARFEDGKMEIWASCQTPYPGQEEVSRVLDIPKENVRVMQIFTGGGFGGKIYTPQLVEAARLAKLSGKPVQLVYTRQEEFMYDRFRPAAAIKIRSGLDSQGIISFWDYKLYFGGQRGAVHFYGIPNHLTQTFNAPRGSQGHPFYTGAWRGPSNNTNTFARESQIEIMAAAAGEDALEFRLKHLKEDRKMTELLIKGAEKFGWTPGKGPSGRGYGIACGKDAGTDVAVFVEVEVDKKSGHVQVKRALCSQNMGMVVNPQGAIIQAEGCLIMGMGYALSEEIKFERRKLLTRNFDTYDFARFSWTPEIEVLLMDAQDDPPQGGGEPAIICMGGAIANAVFDATGARLYRLPLTPERILKAMGEKT
jgi:nicotinate dehydrogenase subunit B